MSIIFNLFKLMLIIRLTLDILIVQGSLQEHAWDHHLFVFPSDLKLAKRSYNVKEKMCESAYLIERFSCQGYELYDSDVCMM